ncbi:MAG TPA: histidine phosphatase family protein [Ilumatobacter sp.]|nr:histidine phosphatase family protein [Ilumatobacter sp.]
MSTTATEGEWQRTRVVLVRHGESNATVSRTIGGPRTCTGLSDLGRLQAARLADRLAATGEVAADVLYSSGYPRAIETGEIIAPALGVDLTFETGFGEHDPGPECDGLSFIDFVDRYGAPDWEHDPYGVTFPGGESIAEFDVRVGSTLSKAVHRHRGATIVVVCHGGVIDRIFRALLRQPSTGMFELNTGNTSLTEFVHVAPGKWQLVRYNDLAHLSGLPAATVRS